jgi:hypothetical protein
MMTAIWTIWAYRNIVALQHKENGIFDGNKNVDDDSNIKGLFVSAYRLYNLDSSSWDYIIKSRRGCLTTYIIKI